MPAPPLVLPSGASPPIYVALCAARPSGNVRQPEARCHAGRLDQIKETDGG